MSTTTRRFVALALAVAAFVALFVAFSGDDARSGAATAGTATPLWSARRVPQSVVEAVGSQHLQTALDSAAPGDGSCFVVDEGNHAVASHGGDTPLNGASTQKLLVAAAALATLGPDFTYTTKVVSSAAPDNGALDKVWLVGSGDPVLATGDFAAYLEQGKWTRDDVTTSMEALADAIVAKGVKHIPGGVVGDDSRYDGQRYVPTWKTEYRTSGDIGPLGALTVNDGFTSWQSRKVAADDPALNAASVLTNLLKARGVDVGSPAVGHAPSGAPDVAQVTSAPLHSIVASMLTSSDNLSAELLTKELGVHAAKQGTTTAGTAAVKAKLTELGLATAPLALVDGSGLDRGNRVTCDLLVAALGLTSRPELATLLDGLPVAGQSGTLVDQLTGPPLVGKLRAKTGSLQGVSGLTGMVDVGTTLRFAFIETGNFSDEPGASIVRAKLAGILGTFPDAPPADTLVPSPN